MGADEWARDGRGLVDALDGLAVSSRR